MCLSFVCTRRLTAWTLDYIFMVILKGVANGKPAIKPTEIRTLYTSSSQVCTAGGRRTLNYFTIILHTPHRLKNIGLVLVLDLQKQQQFIQEFIVVLTQFVGTHPKLMNGVPSGETMVHTVR